MDELQPTSASPFSGKLMRSWIKRFSRIWHWVTALSFLVYVLVNDEPHPLARRLLIFVGVAEVVALWLESSCRRFDESESKVLRDDIAAAKRISQTLSDMHAPRHVFHAHKVAWKKALSEFTGQPFRVIQVGYGDDEAAAFSKEIGDVLTDCGWVGKTDMDVVASSDFHIFSGAAVFMGHRDNGNSSPPNERQIRARWALMEQIGHANIKLASKAKATGFSFPTGTIGIIVGPKA